ncbi:beta-secretase 2-like protein [Labeo rohita]|uniref:Beta-secretase 2-like protein n=1 Tax=Labeo rohita TaxID=84645 RepID=A0A498NNY8_LABRO|nr:beta-secretase 2-like protein [Labeo rohita]
MGMERKSGEAEAAGTKFFFQRINTPRSHITEGVCDAERRTAPAPGGTVRQRGWQQDFTTRPPAVLGTAAAQCGVRASVGAQMAGEGDTSEMASGRCPLREQAGSSNTYQSSGRGVAVKYTQGEWEGELGTDRITIPQGPSGSITINIAAILTSEGFFLPGINWQGILGLAYPLLARPDPSVEPFFNSVVRQTGIPDVFSLQMCGAGVSASTTADPAGGSLIMGGVEPTLYRGSVWYTPILEEWYYQVEVLKLEVGAQNLNLDCKEYNSDKAIVDSGTTLLRLPGNVFSAVVDTIMQTSLIEDFSAGFFDGTKLACWMRGESPWRLFPKISIYLRATNTSLSFRITILPQLYVQPVTNIDSTLDCFRFGISPSANGLVIGATVMEGFYVIFDRAQKRVGFAVSTCAENGGVPFAEIAGPFLAEGVASDCTSGVFLREPVMWVIAYALMGICGLVLIVLLIMLILPCRRHRDGEITDESSLVRHRIK